MNNKGFSLIEVLVTISVLSLIMIIATASITNSFAISNEKSYDILKHNIIKQVKIYIYECDNNLINCKDDYKWENINNTSKTSFSLEIMQKYNYFNEFTFINPINNKEITNCLIVNVTKDNLSNISISLDDSKCV